MKMIPFTKDLIPAAQALVRSNYLEERMQVSALPKEPEVPSLDELCENGLAVAAVENGVLLGFLGAYGPWKPVFHTNDTAGVFSPLHCHAVQKENRINIWQRLYQAAAECWVQVGAASHAITLYSHDEEAQKALYMYGFGVRCMDLMRLTELPQSPAGWTLRELPANEQKKLAPLRRMLTEHLGQSPCFMKHDPIRVEQWIGARAADPPRTFVAEKQGKIAAYMEITHEGENFVSSTPGTANICGAYVLQEYRGEGAAQAVLAHLLRTVAQEGTLRLGVDCESINPTALKFWSKYFTAYTHSVVRRVDECAIDR